MGALGSACGPALRATVDVDFDFSCAAKCPLASSEGHPRMVPWGRLSLVLFSHNLFC